MCRGGGGGGGGGGGWQGGGKPRGIGGRRSGREKSRR